MGGAFRASSKLLPVVVVVVDEVWNILSCFFSITVVVGSVGLDNDDDEDDGICDPVDVEFTFVRVLSFPFVGASIYENPDADEDDADGNCVYIVYTPRSFNLLLRTYVRIQ